VFFKKVPHWSLFLNTWDMIGVFAYTQVFALLESTMIMLALVFLGVILPARFLRDRFAAHGSMIVLLTSGWVVADQSDVIFFFATLLWPSLYLASVGVSYLLIYLCKRLEESMNSFAERLTVLLYVYIPIAFLSVVIVILRNI
jgi:hypothetical protein